MNTALEQSIASAVTSAVVSTLAGFRAKHNDDIQSLCEMLEKALPAKDSSAPSPDAQTLGVCDPDNKPKAVSSPDLTSKGSQERWNQADLGYFDPYLDVKAHGPGKVVLVGKDVYYRNEVLFVKRVQNLVTFKVAATVKTSMVILLFGSALEWYTSRLSNFDRDVLNNTPG